MYANTVQWASSYTPLPIDKLGDSYCTLLSNDDSPQLTKLASVPYGKIMASMGGICSTLESRKSIREALYNFALICELSFFWKSLWSLQFLL